MRRRAQRERGWVTVEMAFAALGLGVAVVLCVGLFSVFLAQLRCADAASEIARQAARGDVTAVQVVEQRLPASAEVRATTGAGEVEVTVVETLRPWGPWFPAVTVRADATAVRQTVGGS